ncbi:SIMPL domain-containing protein [Kineobactrum salinum]|uniref:SIMPL domain-containing protein n=1 Tax=Kineobactrum salinum TaxID=2708301 RepID=A0A6C0TXT6_9GAMM|nr:SIMPL domain-containing protein [Kineobactrum salinum]QIB64586.1 SIMPL domain-containing protein [Kineobactrum salinum]
MIIREASGLKTALAGLLVLAALAGSHPAAAAESEPQPRLRVTGEGTASVEPDMALLHLTVTREGDSARAALDANSAAMKEVLAAMRAQGIAGRDLQTANFSIEPRYQHQPRNQSGVQEPPRIVGYMVRNSLTVRLRDIARLGAVLDESVSLGVNEGGNIQFLNDDPAEAMTQARQQAVRDALARGRTLAEAAGVKLGRILEISERVRQQQPMPMARMAMEKAYDSVPVAVGENSYQVMVDVVLALEQ